MYAIRSYYDAIELLMPFQFHLEPVMDQQNIASLFYGPILLAAQETKVLKEWRTINLNATDIGKSISGDLEQLQFNIRITSYNVCYTKLLRF